jgi:uncharacterized protein YndB with AHSA1/START domain
VATSSETQDSAAEADSEGKSTSVSDSDPGQRVVEISRTIQASPDQLWQLMTSPHGAAALLGDGAVLGGKGEAWHTADGPHGVVRSYHPLEQLRVSWHADQDAPASLVEMDLRPSGDATELVVRHERLAGPETIDLRQHWSAAVDRLADVASG